MRVRDFNTERADAAFERIAAAKEDAAKSAKFATLLANQHQLSRRQRTTLSAITDTYLGELSSMDSDASPARPQYELLPETSDSDDEGSHGSEDSSA